MANFDLSNLALKAVCPTNEIILDDKGLPSVMVRIPKFKISDVLDGGSSETHPAFIIDGKEIDEIYISKYQNVIYDGRAYSLPAEDPKVSLNFDTARQACEAKGNGWHLMTQAERAAIAMWCKKNGHMPAGNNNYGKDSTESLYKAIPTSKDGDYPDRTGRVATGTGPLTWSHDGTLEGIWDLNGNVWEWTGGLRLVDGEIQVIANNNAASQDYDQGSSSSAWKAIMPSGEFVSPGTSGTLKFDGAKEGNANTTSANVSNVRLNTTVQYPQYTASGAANQNYGYSANTFETTAAVSGVNVPEVLKVLGIYPYDMVTDGHGRDYIWVRSYGERLPFCGGGWSNGTNAGVFALGLNNPRSYSSSTIGFRSAFVNL